MKQEDNPYEALLNALKTTSPVLHRPEEMTETIISRIESLPRRKNRYLLWGSWASGLAAMFLLCLFVKETIFPYSPEEQRMAFRQEAITEVPSLSKVATSEKVIKNKEDKELSLSEMGRIISVLIRKQQDADTKKMLAIKRQIEITLK